MSTDYPAQILNHDASEIELEGRINFTDPANAPGGSLPDPLTTPINLATTDTSKVPLKITLPVDFDLGAYDAIEIEDENGLRLFSFDVGGFLAVAANPALGTPSVSLSTDGSAALIILQQGSDAASAEINVRPGAGQTATIKTRNVDGSNEHQFASAATPGTGRIGFFGHAAAERQTGVAVNAAAIHAALVAYGLITA